MGARGRLRIAEGGVLLFRCPGCDEMHQVQVGDGPGPRWSFDGNFDRPTFSPSVLVKTGHHCAGQEGKECWCTYEARFGEPAPFKCSVCHSFVRDGQIQFLADSSHAMAGQTVDLPQMEDV